MRRLYRISNLDKRKILAALLKAKVTKTKIAETLGRDRSTIRRNWWHNDEVPQADGYLHVTAQTVADQCQVKRHKLEQHEDLRNEVIGKLKVGKNRPDEISCRKVESVPDRYK